MYFDGGGDDDDGDGDDDGHDGMMTTAMMNSSDIASTRVRLVGVVGLVVNIAVIMLTALAFTICAGDVAEVVVGYVAAVTVVNATVFFLLL